MQMQNNRVSVHVVASAFVYLAIPFHATVAEGKDADEQVEVHAVGIYEGVTETGNKIHGPKAVVEVIRPGKNVILMLSSAGPVTWEIAAKEDTKLKQVYLLGRPPQAVKGLVDDSIVVKTWEIDHSASAVGAYNRNSAGFIRFVQWASKRTGQPRLASFEGVYRPASPIRVHLLQADPKLSATYPEPTSEAQLPAAAQGVKFESVHLLDAAQWGRGGRQAHLSFGDFSLAGPLQNALKPLPDGVSRIAYDAAGKQYYGIAGHDVVKVDLDKQKFERMDVGLDVPPLSWPCEVTFDTKRRRLILGTSGGGGYLYAYSPEKSEWSVISRRPGAFDAFSYSEQDDCLYGVLFGHGGDGPVASLAKVNALGAVIDTMRLEEPVVPGTLAAGPGPSTTRVTAVGGYVAIVTSAPALDETITSYIYLIDPQAKKVWITGRYESPSPAGSPQRFSRDRD
jgi:hypothetical protein